MNIVHYSGIGSNRTFVNAESREDSKKFTEAHVLTGGMRDEMDAFYDGIDRDLGEGLSGEVR